MEKYKTPISVLVVVHTPDSQILLLERTDHPGYWQSITGSQHRGETLIQTAKREISEETGLDATSFVLTNWNFLNKYEIFQEWRWRYAPEVTQNTEHTFGLLVPEPVQVTISAREHLRYGWFPKKEAAEKVFSWSNAEAIQKLHPSSNNSNKNSSNAL